MIHIKVKIDFFIFLVVLSTIFKQDIEIIILSYIPLLNTIIFLSHFLSCLSYLT